ncbi:unnamed protein product [Rotaria magnacalcarata]|uniref:U-box domain-containing protein n=1 Tax=Rotaria magnacalcarata TaxID=392030 RepID=A0A820CFG0_9BILA|nr:unnamed protein product [Rotaria magnacalcarata]
MRNGGDDPVIAADGYVYERAAIIRWIQRKGTSPLTCEPLNIADLRSEYFVKRLCQLYQPNAVRCARQNNTVSIGSSPMTQFEIHTNQQKSCKQYCNIKHILLTIMTISLITIPLIVATMLILFLVQLNLISQISASTKHSNNYIHLRTIYKLPNDCTLSNVISLFSWNNVPQFNYTYYSKLYKTVSSRIILTFAFRHDASYWCLDGVSVIDISSSVELVTDGNFENNPSDDFFLCNSYGNSTIPLVLDSAHACNGLDCFCGGAVRLPNYLNQILGTKVGQLYRITFWLSNLGDTPNSAQVAISY